jgi:inorganic phosphate transporter, PiT family
MPGRAQALKAVSLPSVTVGAELTCRIRYQGRVMGLSARRMLDAAHYFSSGAVSYARGLNDTPKIAALLLVGNAVSADLAIVGVALVMAAGGLVSARRVAETMSHRVTEINPGQGFAANIITSLLVIWASKMGMPVSTTHVSCGSLFGIGALTRQAHWNVIGSILMAWVFTLPVAGALGAVLANLLGTSF